MKVTKELIDRFIKNQCNADEAKAVAHYLQDHPYFLDELFPKANWEEITSPNEIPEIKEREIRTKIWSKLQFNSSKTKHYWWLAKAASILLFLSIKIFINPVKQPVTPKATELAYNLVKINYGKDVLTLKIEDGTIILLESGSEIRYPEHFIGKERRFILVGSARFKVAKDRTRPFNVYAGGTITTALGTDFTISAYPKNINTNIMLHEGKVVVKPQNNQASAKMKAVYLHPGEQLSVNRTSYLTSLSSINRNESKISIEKNGITELTETSITFRNQSLKNIYRFLDEELNTKTHYRDADISNRYFTGSFKRDSLSSEQIIEETSSLNNLAIEKRIDTYYLNSTTPPVNNRSSPKTSKSKTN